MNIFITLIIAYIVLTGTSILVGKNWPKIEEGAVRPPLLLCLIPIFQLVIIGLAAFAYARHKSTRLRMFISKYTQVFQDWYYND